MKPQPWPAGVTRADLMTIAEAAEALGYRDGRALRNAVRDGRITGYAPIIGRGVLLARADVERLQAPAAA